MTSVSPKLLALLGVSVVVAGFGAFRLLSVEPVAETGFEPSGLLSAVVNSPEPDMAPLADVPLGRNPFERSNRPEAAEPGAEIAPADEPGGEQPTSGEPTATETISGGGATPAFPLPDLVEPVQGDDDRNARADTSFEG